MGSSCRGLKSGTGSQAAPLSKDLVACGQGRGGVGAHHSRSTCRQSGAGRARRRQRSPRAVAMAATARSDRFARAMGSQRCLSRGGHSAAVRPGGHRAARVAQWAQTPVSVDSVPPRGSCVSTCCPPRPRPPPTVPEEWGRGTPAGGGALGALFGPRRRPALRVLSHYQGSRGPGRGGRAPGPVRNTCRGVAPASGPLIPGFGESGSVGGADG